MTTTTTRRRRSRRAPQRSPWIIIAVTVLVIGICAAVITVVITRRDVPVQGHVATAITGTERRDMVATGGTKAPSIGATSPNIAARDVKPDAFSATSPSIAVAPVMKAEPQPEGMIVPGELWPDDRGRHIQAHGGGIIKVEDKYYWYGVDMGGDIPGNKKVVACYVSGDLMHWSFCSNILALDKPKDYIGSRWVLERPKIYYNEPTRKFVMYMHLDNALGTKHAYEAAEVGIAISDTVDGNYTFLRKFRPLGNQSRDIGQFIDDDGKAYLISEDRKRGFHIYLLSADFLTIERDVCLFPDFLEGGGIVHHDGLYYFVGSHLTGWDPNPNVYATATSLAGPWSSFKNIAPPYVKTYGSQSTFLMKVIGSKATTVVFMGDLWNPETLWDSRYYWMPLEIGQGRMRLPGPQSWKINVITGEHRVGNP